MLTNTTLRGIITASLLALAAVTGVAQAETKSVKVMCIFRPNVNTDSGGT